MGLSINAGRGATSINENSFNDHSFNDPARFDSRSEKVADFLRTQGVDVDRMPSRVIDQLAKLSEKDLNKLVDINRQIADRVDAASDDVNGYVVF